MPFTAFMQYNLAPHESVSCIKTNNHLLIEYDTFIRLGIIAKNGF